MKETTDNEVLVQECPSYGRFTVWVLGLQTFGFWECRVLSFRAWGFWF